MHRTSKVLTLGSMLGALAFGSGASAEDGSEVDLTGTWGYADLRGAHRERSSHGDRR
jgi:hypothetical protein